VVGAYLLTGVLALPSGGLLAGLVVSWLLERPDHSDGDRVARPAVQR
jgi:hypothetical protein